MENKTSEAQQRAVKNWQANNKEYTNYLKSRSTAKSFIKNKATLEDLENFEQLIQDIKVEKYNK
jgi:hypothetical protein